MKSLKKPQHTDKRGGWKQRNSGETRISVKSKQHPNVIISQEPKVSMTSPKNPILLLFEWVFVYTKNQIRFNGLLRKHKKLGKRTHTHKHTNKNSPRSDDWLEWLHLLHGSSYSGQPETTEAQEPEKEKANRRLWIDLSIHGHCWGFSANPT